MWGDGQHPPHLAGAVDSIAPTQGAQLQPCRVLGLLWVLLAIRVPQGMLGGLPSRDLHGAMQTGLGCQELPWQSRGKPPPFLKKNSECFREGFGCGVREDTSGGNGLFKNKKTPQNIITA